MGLGDGPWSRGGVLGVFLSSVSRVRPGLSVGLCGWEWGGPGPKFLKVGNCPDFGFGNCFGLATPQGVRLSAGRTRLATEPARRLAATCLGPRQHHQIRARKMFACGGCIVSSDESHESTRAAGWPLVSRTRVASLRVEGQAAHIFDYIPVGCGVPFSLLLSDSGPGPCCLSHLRQRALSMPTVSPAKSPRADM